MCGVQDKTGESISHYLSAYNKARSSSSISFRRGDLVLSHEAMISLFVPIVNSIVEHVKFVLSKVRTLTSASRSPAL